MEVTRAKLCQIPYSELKKIAKKHGIKGNLKAEKIIAALSLAESDDMESFSTPAQKLINSSKKNKEEKFDEDLKTPLETPRRGTYTIGSPISLNVDTPATVASDAFGSKLTPEMASVKKLRSRKVSFMNPNRTPHTPKNSNIRLRPKTPVAPFNGNISLSLSPVPQLEEKFEKSVNVSLLKTPQSEVFNESSSSTKLLNFKDDASAKKKQATTPRSTRSITFKNEVSAKKKQISTPSSMKSLAVKSEISAKKKHIATPRTTRSITFKNELSAKKQISTPSSTKSLAVKSEISAKKKLISTPNFKKIHEKAFEKMESIVDYQKRKATKNIGLSNFKVTKPKSKIPKFGGIPFIPSASQSTLSKSELNLKDKFTAQCTRSKPISNLKDKRTKEKQKSKHDEENAVKRNKSKFDLKASLSRKLGYKPYSGPLKPLTPSNKLNTSNISCYHNAKEPVNKVVNTNRLQNRAALKGVRTNKRFELQMKNRNLQ